MTAKQVFAEMCCMVFPYQDELTLRSAPTDTILTLPPPKSLDRLMPQQ